MLPKTTIEIKSEKEKVGFVEDSSAKNARLQGGEKNEVLFFPV